MPLGWGLFSLKGLDRIRSGINGLRQHRRGESAAPANASNDVLFPLPGPFGELLIGVSKAIWTNLAARSQVLSLRCLNRSLSWAALKLETRLKKHLKSRKGLLTSLLCLQATFHILLLLCGIFLSLSIYWWRWRIFYDYGIFNFLVSRREHVWVGMASPRRGLKDIVERIGYPPLSLLTGPLAEGKIHWRRENG